MAPKAKSKSKFTPVDQIEYKIKMSQLIFLVGEIALKFLSF
jgi:hypothetical protein